MEHPLDFPAWNALISRNKNLSEGNERVKYFHEEVAPFVGMSELSPDEFELLYYLIPLKRRMVIIISKEIEIPKQWTLTEHIKALQMVYTQDAPPGNASAEIIQLQNKDVPQMLDLTAITHPGPFLKRTIEFGNYEGIFENGNLISMAGERMHPGQYVEISAVCTHPDHLGKGYASQLIQSQVRRIKASSGVPFLHVKDDNLPAIGLYKKLGFEVRKQMNIYVFRKD
ncbi:MAG: GNAT family N-acetyltransferase [Bacteroidota bacterium]|nr:GNAT family N-acetyltransferase [Bacteroidota bacterium]